LVEVKDSKVGFLKPNLVKIFLVLEDLPKVGLLQSNLVKTALIYFVVTIYLRLWPRIIGIGQNEIVQ
jgi:hypothetical protein